MQYWNCANTPPQKKIIIIIKWTSLKKTSLWKSVCIREKRQS